MASSSLIQNVVPFFEIRIPVHVEWYDDIRVVKSVPTTSTFSDFCAYFREIKNISKLVALMNGLHVVDFRGRTSLRNFVTIENASVRFNFMKMAELLHADYLMSMGYGFPPVMRIDARDRSVFSVDVTVSEPPPAPESLSSLHESSTWFSIQVTINVRQHNMDIKPLPIFAPNDQRPRIAMNTLINYCMKLSTILGPENANGITLASPSAVYLDEASAVEWGALTYRMKDMPRTFLESILDPTYDIDATDPPVDTSTPAATTPTTTTTTTTTTTPTTIVNSTSTAMTTTTATTTTATSIGSTTADSSAAAQCILKDHQWNMIRWMRHREGRSYDTDIWVRLTPLLEYNPIFTNFRLTPLHAITASKFGGIVADDVGLGKTRTVVAHIRLQRDQDAAPTLIVTPLNVLDQWLTELKEQGVPHKEVYGTRRPRTIRNDEVQAIVTTFHTVMHDRYRQGGGILSGVQWQRIVLDESHRLSGSSLSASLSSLHGNTRWAISATPGKSAECLIRQLKWIGLDFPMTPLAAQQVLFRGWYDDSSTESYVRPPFECVFLTMLLRHVARRRAHDDAESAAHVNVVFDHRAVPRDALRGDYDCALRATRARIEYSVSGAMVSRLFEQLREQLSSGIFDGRSGPGDIFASVRETATVDDDAMPVAAREGCCPICYEAKPIHLYIRTPCDHDICAACAAALLQAAAIRSGDRVPSVLQGVCPMCRAPFDNKTVRLLAAPPPHPTDSTGAASQPVAEISTGKMRALLHFINEEPREKVVVFTEFASTLKHAQDCLRASAPDVRVIFINGTMTRAQRARALRAFQAFDSQEGPVVFLLTTRSSSCGINLQCATRILFLEPTLDATTRHQAIGRLKRYGQEANEIRVVTLFTSGTIEEKLMPYAVDTDVEWHSTKYNVMALLDS